MLNENRITFDGVLIVMAIFVPLVLLVVFFGGRAFWRWSTKDRLPENRLKMPEKRPRRKHLFRD